MSAAPETKNDPPLTREERRLSLCYCLIKLGWSVTFGLTTAARMAHTLELCGHDMLRLSQFNSTAWGINGIMGSLIGPIFAALSDAHGRMPFLLLGRIGLGCWFTGCALSTKLWHYGVTELLTWGFLMCGYTAVEDAFFADLFGERPELSGRIRSQNAVYASIAGFVSPFLGIWCAARGRLTTIYLGAVCCALQCGVILWHGDTLTATGGKRRPFKVSMANPFTSLTLLFRNGKGLRRLGLCATCFTGCTASWSTQEPYQFGAIGMSPAENSVYDACFQATGALYQPCVVQPLLKRLGNRRCFQWTSLSSAVFYVLVSQAWRPSGLGISHSRRLLQYFLAMSLLQSPFNEPSFFCIQPMVMKQGISSCPDAGNGAIAAAYGGLENVVTASGTFLLGWLARMFIRGDQEGWLPWYFSWGPGGHFVVCAVVRTIGAAILWTTPDDQLDLDESPSPADAGGGEASSEAMVSFYDSTGKAGTEPALAAHYSPSKQDVR